MRKAAVFAVLIMVLFGFQAWAACPPTELIISEYVEGSSVNKAIEIFNGTGAEIVLASYDYELWVYFNGSTTAGTEVDLTGTVPAGGTFVVCDDGAAAGILAVCDQQTSSSLFNGDDAIVLIKYAFRGDGRPPSDVVVDSIGQVGVDPGSQWGSGDTSTQNNTIRRMEAVCDGDTNTGDAFDPAVEWEGYAEDTFDGLGAHSVLPVELMAFSVE